MIALDELDDIDEIDAVDPAEKPPAPKATIVANAVVPAPAAEPPRDDLMTAAQRRLLFRIAAERGVPTDEIQKWLENHWGLKPLKTISKHEASRLIEKLTQNGHAGAAP